MLKPEDFKEDAEPVIDWIDRYLNNIASFPVKSGVHRATFTGPSLKKLPFIPKKWK